MSTPTGPMTARETIQLLPPRGRVALYAAVAVLGAVLPSVQVALVLLLGIVPLWFAVVWSLFSSLTTAFGLIAVNNVTKGEETTVTVSPRPDDLPGEIVEDPELEALRSEVTQLRGELSVAKTVIRQQEHPVANTETDPDVQPDAPEGNDQEDHR